MSFLYNIQDTTLFVCRTLYIPVVSHNTLWNKHTIQILTGAEVNTEKLCAEVV